MALDSMGGFTLVLAALKAWLEHDIALDPGGGSRPGSPRFPIALLLRRADHALPLIPVRRSPRGRALHAGQGSSSVSRSQRLIADMQNAAATAIEILCPCLCWPKFPTD